MPLKEKPIKKVQAHVSERKKATAKEMKSLASKNGTIMLLNIKGISSSQLQMERKKFRDEISLIIVKKNVATKVFEENEKMKGLIPWLEQSEAILYSNLDPFELAIKFCEGKIPARAKPGQTAIEDIVVEKGPTNLMAGPALSDLSKVGLKVGIEGGKIAVKERKVLVKKGDKISADIADALLKLEILPFSVGLEPIAAFEKKSEKVFTSLNISRNEFVNELKVSKVKALGFAVNIGYAAKETIKMLLGKAEAQFTRLNSIITQTQ